MSSKKVTCLLVSLAVFVTSCSPPKVGEAPPDQGQQKLEGTQCLSGLPPVIEHYAAGVATDQEVAAGWDCATTAIKTFKKYVYGRSSDRFESAELADFLKKNFLDASSPEIRPQFRLEIMRIKQLFFGGSVEYLTRAELDKIISMLEDLKTISLRLNPYMKLLVQKWSLKNSGSVNEDLRYFEGASEEIQAAARILANMIEQNNQSYELNNFVNFMREFSIFTEQEWSLTEKIEKFMPVMKKVKKAVAGGDQEKIGPSEWKSFVLLGVRGYLQYLRYFYFIKSVADTGTGLRLGYLARSLEDLFGAFKDLVQEKPADPSCGLDKSAEKRVYMSCISKDEISEILTALSQAWSDFKTSDTLVEELMKLKKVYFGGSDLNISNRDFERGKNKVSTLRSVVEKFMPYYAVYTLEWDRGNFDEKTAWQFFEGAEASLNSSAVIFGTLLEDDYNLDNITILLAELDRLYPRPTPEDGRVVAVKKYLPLVKDIKNIVFSEKDSFIRKNQWGPFLKHAARFYNSFLLYTYFVEKEKYGTLPFANAFKHLVDKSLFTFKDVLAGKKNQALTIDELNLVSQRLIQVEVLPPGLSAKSLEQVIRVALNRLLWPAESRLNGSVPNTLNAITLDNIGKEIQIWHETESYLLSLTAQGPLKPTDLKNQISKTLKGSLSPALRAGLTEAAMVFAGPVPQTINADGHLNISNIESYAYDSFSVARINLNRTIARLLIRSAITSRGRLERYEGVTVKEAQVVFDQIKPVVVQAGLLDETNTTFVESRFREANIFSAHSNGDTYANFAEMSDLAGMIISGITVNELFRKDIEAACVSTKPVDANTAVSEECLRKIYIQKTPTYMMATPEYVKFFERMKSNNLTYFIENILKAAGHIPNDQNVVRLMDSDLSPHVVQYLEMTIAKYDANKDGRINVVEAKSAFPSFRGLLAEVTKDQSLIKEKDLEALFMYILYYGKPPGGVKDFLFKWLPWKGNPEKWQAISADREIMAGILGTIADLVAAQAKEKRALFTEEDEKQIRKAPEFLGGA